jgi:hypothetical protein
MRAPTPLSVILLALSIAGALSTDFPTATSGTTVQPITTAAPTGEFETTQYDIIPGVTDGQNTIPQRTMTFVFPTCVQTITPDTNGYLPPGSCNALWDYYPSFDAALAFAGLFGALTVIHIFLAIKHKKVRTSEAQDATQY